MYGTGCGGHQLQHQLQKCLKDWPVWLRGPWLGAVNSSAHNVAVTVLVGSNTIAACARIFA